MLDLKEKIYKQVYIKNKNFCLLKDIKRIKSHRVEEDSCNKVNRVLIPLFTMKTPPK